MDADRVVEMFERLGLNDEKRAEFVRFAQQGPLSLEPEQPADFRLDCSTLSDDARDDVVLGDPVA